MKLIDAEKLKAEIEKNTPNHLMLMVYRDHILALIDSLQQEQQEEPDRGLDVTDFCKPIDPGIAKCVADHWWEMMDEEPDKSLEEAAEKHIRKVVDAAGHPGWDWATQDIADAFIAGAKWQKEQMLKDAVEGYVNYYEDGGGKLMAEAQVGCPYHIGDKVRLIIVKAEEE